MKPIQFQIWELGPGPWAKMRDALGEDHPFIFADVGEYVWHYFTGEGWSVGTREYADSGLTVPVIDGVVIASAGQIPKKDIWMYSLPQFRGRVFNAGLRSMLPLLATKTIHCTCTYIKHYKPNERLHSIIPCEWHQGG